jgi:2-polyprenyl-6-methoxyphenol hydroxylase-like FAD-dependent oxidoreductase
MAAGAGLGVEDALVLAQELAAHASVTEALAAFTARRLPRAQLIVENSVRIGEIEMSGGDQRQATQMLGTTIAQLQQPF